MKQKFKEFNPLVAPLLSLFFVISSSCLFTTFVTLKLKNENFTETLIGLIHSSFYFGYLVGSVRAEKLIYRIGYIRSFVAFAALFGASILVQGLYIHTILWMLTRFIAGVSLAALYVIIESWLLSGSTQNTRGRILSVYMIILYGAQSLSQMFIGFVDLNTLTAFLVFGILTYLSILPVSINYSKTPESSSEITKKSIKEIFRHAPYSFWGCLISGLILSAIYSFLPYYAQSENLRVSYIMTITIAGGFVLQWPIGLFSDLFERRKVLIASSALLFLSCLMMIFFSSVHHMLAYLFCFFIGGFSFVIYPISISHATDKFDSKYIPFIIGIMSVLYGIGATVGPFMTSLFMEFDSSGIFIFIALFALISTLSGIYYKIKIPKRTPKSEKTEFMPISAIAPLSTDTSIAIKQTISVSKKDVHPEKKSQETHPASQNDNNSESSK
ncbi:MAG: MFS transporter [Parachlamydiales bacterium]|jgi:MFS family permease